MSVYKRKGAETYSYDFWCRGHRFLGETGESTKRKAEVFEALRREEAKASTAQIARLDAPQTWHEAATRWFNEVGAFHKNVETTLWSLAWLTREIGAGTPLSGINDNVVARLVAKRRGEKRKVGRDRSAQRPVGPATVNRTMTEPLRKVMIRAERVWRVPVGDITWRSHMLAEPKERVREASVGEEAKIHGELSRGYEVAMEFCFDNGLRRMELIGLKKTDVDFFSKIFTVLGKGGKVRTIPMSDKAHEILWSLKDTPTDYVFTYVAARNDARKQLVKGTHYPLTDAGMRTAARRAIKRSGVVNFRPHDTRHTAATRLLRASNLRVVQNLLGHSDVSTTTKYAHAMEQDLRNALNAASPAKRPATDMERKAKG